MSRLYWCAEKAQEHRLGQGAVTMGKVFTSIGLMSGTSVDAIDVALLETNGRDFVRLGPSASVPYEAVFADRLRQAVADAQGLSDRQARPGCLAEVERELTELHEVAVREFLSDNGVSADTVDVIGFHGHTVWHRPPQNSVTAGITVQLGDGNALAAALGITVAYDMRAEDVAAGGQGAPLVPVYHRALASKIPQRPLVIVNIGGVANITWVGLRGELIAFDTGPGNALLDDFMRARTNKSFDAGGAFADNGEIDEDALEVLMTDEFFFAPPPKSIDRNAFDGEAVRGLPDNNAAATLTAFTAETIARSLRHLPMEPRLWVVAGGGRKNSTLMQMLAERVENAVVPAEAVDLHGDMLEAEAWGYLAVRVLRGLPLTYPGTTGVGAPMPGGRLAKVR